MKYRVRCGVCGQLADVTAKQTVAGHARLGSLGNDWTACEGGKVRNGPDVPATYADVLALLEERLAQAEGADRETLAQARASLIARGRL